RQDRRHLIAAHPVPVLVARRDAGMAVHARPFAGHGRVRVLRRAAALLRLREQRLVVLPRRLERVGAHDGLARVVAVAMAPRGRLRRVVADERLALSAPELLDARRAVAAEVARVAPELAVLIEIVGREQVSRQRLDTGWVRAGACRADPARAVLAGIRRAEQ